MNATRTGLWVSMVAGLMTLGGCAGGEAYGPPRAVSHEPSGPRSEYAPPAASAAPMEPAAPMAEGRSRRAPADEERPGLGTEWGESRHSSISRVGFERADFSSPFASLALFYNDQQGVNAMASVSRAYTQSFSLVGGMVTVDLRDEGGRAYGGFISAGKNHVIGEAGRRYSIVLHNRTEHRFEVVLSVDGLDVMDGQRAAFDKRGYILDPHAELEVDGFRQSMDTVAAFRFGSVRDSYAGQKHGDTRNVGVIGVALFHERGMPYPTWTSAEVRTRRNANPFPGTFATAP